MDYLSININFKMVRHTHQLGLYNLVARFGHFDYLDQNYKSLGKEKGLWVENNIYMKFS